MKAWLASPGLSLSLFVGWLLLNQSASVGHLVLAALLALLLPTWFPATRSRILRWRTLLPMTRLTGVVLWDVVIANLTVASLILGPSQRLSPGFVWVPLALNDERAITVLAAIITLTPGTLSVDLSEDGRALLVHALQADDPVGLVASIQARYEAPLKEIFQ